jgi:hypothetical protein
VAGSAAGFTARFQGPGTLRAGTWYLSGVTANLSRSEEDLRVAFTDFDAAPTGDGGVVVVCGDGNIDYPETCDPPNGTTCSDTCVLSDTCGDGVIDWGEQCETGNVDCAYDCRYVTTTALPAAGWDCTATQWFDSVCDCGCNYVDPSCDVQACANCSTGAGGCSDDCADIDPDNSGLCLP